MTRANSRTQVDVLVIGAGFAGVTAAIHAARAGVSCAIASTSHLFSGSSFFPGTWGFGLIAPDGDADKEDLRDTILRVGCGVADKTLVERLVDGVHAGVRELESYGLAPLRAQAKGEKEFIPCFDHKYRDWYGMRQPDVKAVTERQLDLLGVRRLDGVEVLSLQTNEGAVCGALAATREGILQIDCKSVIIASGGLAGVHAHAFGFAECCGLGQLLALEAGAQLVNVEFAQMMPGFVRPCPKTIYNEKVFRCSSFYDARTGEELFSDLAPDVRRELLECRAGHGPFTSRLPSREVDLRIFARFMEQEDAVELRYDPAVLQDPPEFVKRYFDWLKTEKGLTPQDAVRIGIFYHAANGGIAIDQDGFTGVPGLYACGEATGGVHGADRLGGLSTANALVFGRVAGEQAARSALRAHTFAKPVWIEPHCFARTAAEWTSHLRWKNYAAMTLGRSEQALTDALARTRELPETAKLPDDVCDRSEMLAQSRRLEAVHILSQAVLQAALLRRESRGSHYRPDFPQLDAQMERQIIIRRTTDGEITAQWK